MPRRQFLDAPETRHDDFLRRLGGALVIATGVNVYPWALVPNHLHPVVRTGATPLATPWARS